MTRNVLGFIWTAEGGPSSWRTYCASRNEHVYLDYVGEGLWLMTCEFDQTMIKFSSFNDGAEKYARACIKAEMEA